jgi:pyridine nucleotide-disulfide oxidoreductase family protein
MATLKRLVLAGAGHAHAQVLLDLIRQPLAAVDAVVEVVLVSPCTLAPYSGRLPAWLAGDYAWQACCIDFSSLCQRAGVRLVVGEITTIDPEQRRLRLADGSDLDYDWLSLNIGSTLTPPDDDTLQMVPMRPLAALQSRWQAVLERVEQLQARAGCDTASTSFNLVVVGGGAAGIESMLAAHQQLTTLAPDVRFIFTLATRGPTLTSGLARAAGTALLKHLKKRHIEVRHGFAACGVAHGAVVAADGSELPADVVLWATGAQAFAWPGIGGLATDASGFVRVDAGLRSMSHPNILATGDCASWVAPLPKAGVYAVHMGPVLVANLRAAVAAAEPHVYQPQRRYLVLIGTGDHHAVASWGPFGWQGDWVYSWKQAIDQRFLDRFTDPMP